MTAAVLLSCVAAAGTQCTGQARCAQCDKAHLWPCAHSFVYMVCMLLEVRLWVSLLLQLLLCRGVVGVTVSVGSSSGAEAHLGLQRVIAISVQWFDR